MRYHRSILTILLAVFLFSCKKEHEANPVETPSDPPGVPTRHILLKDITIPSLPSPFYHFEYNKDSLVTKADFGSGFTIYDILYDGNKIGEMQNNIFVNHDTLRYFYDSGNKVALISFIDETNVIYRHVNFTYQGNLVKEIRWNHKAANGGFLVDRIVTFAFYPDENVKSIKDERISSRGDVPGHIFLKTFEQYDKEENVDDFSLIHDGIHDHLFLLQGFRLQKNNPKKEMYSVDGIDFYMVSYSYIYNTDHTPSTKTGDLLYLSGADTGKKFKTNSIYTYY